MSGHHRSARVLETLESRLLLARNAFRRLPIAEEVSAVEEVASLELVEEHFDQELFSDFEVVTSDETERVEATEIEVAAVASVITSNPQQIKISLIGDSLTSGIEPTLAARRGIPATTSYRPYLWNHITSARPDLDIEFTGPTTSNGARTSADPAAWKEIPESGMAHAAFPGLSSASFLPDSFAATDPYGESGNGADGWATYETDIAVMLVGINDLISGHALTGSARSVETSVRAMISALRLHNPSVDIVLGTMPEVSERFSLESDVAGLNDILSNLGEPEDDWIGSTEGSPIHLVDHANGVDDLPVYDVEKHSTDGLHPNDEGDVILAANWWNTIEELLPPLPIEPLQPIEELTDQEVTSDIPSEQPAAQTPVVSTISIRARELAIVEGESAQFIVTRTGNVSQELSIQLRATGNADSGEDFESPSEFLEFDVGESEILFELKSTIDDRDEYDEFVTLSIGKLEGYLTGFGSSVLIRNL